MRITPAIPIIGGLLYIFTMGSLLRTTFTDPGIIPRASQDEAAYIEKQIGTFNRKTCMLKILIKVRVFFFFLLQKCQIH